jgi:glycine dehydrogenase subunit 2
MPVGRVEKKPDGSFYLNHSYPKSIGQIAPFYGNFAVMLKAYAYIKRLGREGLNRVAEYAVLNANYLRKRLEKILHIPYDHLCMHEFVATPGDYPVRALDIAKALLDCGIHAPTIYFPLIVKECLMIEPTETESKQTLDIFVAAIEHIMKQAATDPDALLQSPLRTPVRRLDETAAARNMVLTDDA